MIRTIILRMADPMYTRAYLGFLPFILLACYGIVLLWKGWTWDIAPWFPRWMYFVGGAICLLALPAYTLFMKQQGLLW